ncbi:MAG: single-stranded DNA-binding protein [Bacilli bacterium]|jgi:single-stranded DNA-binding protein|nr:single-stranded DNA-binding protein [Bacilli bacterium]
MQRITFVGKITQDINLSEAKNGQAMTYLKVVDTDNGNPTYIDFLVIGKMAIDASLFLQKGNLVYIEGYVKNKREEIAGKMNYNFSFHATFVKFLD